MAKPQRSEKDMKDIAIMLACPHRWSDPRKVTIVEGKKLSKADQQTCRACGTHRIKYEDGTGALLPPDGVSEKPI